MDIQLERGVLYWAIYYLAIRVRNVIEDIEHFDVPQTPDYLLLHQLDSFRNRVKVTPVLCPDDFVEGDRLVTAANEFVYSAGNAILERLQEIRF